MSKTPVIDLLYRMTVEFERYNIDPPESIKFNQRTLKQLKSELTKAHQSLVKLDDGIKRPYFLLFGIRIDF